MQYNGGTYYQSYQAGGPSPVYSQVQQQQPVQPLGLYNPEQMSLEYTYAPSGMPSTSARPLDAAAGARYPPSAPTSAYGPGHHYYSHQQPQHPSFGSALVAASDSASSVASSSGTSTSSVALMSPTSTATTRSSMSLHTPLTPYFPIGGSQQQPIDATKDPVMVSGSHRPSYTQESWFGSMQDSYLASVRQNPPDHLLAQQKLQNPYAHSTSDYLSHLQRTPTLGMQRMSVSAPEPIPSSSSSRRKKSSTGLLSVTTPPNRRASVGTFQPTAARPTSSPQRPPFQPSLSSEPVLPSQSPVQLPYFGYEAPTEPQLTPRLVTDIRSPAGHNQRGKLRIEVPKQAVGHEQRPQSSAAALVPSGEDTSEVDRLFAEVFGGQTIPTTIVTASPPQTQASTFSPPTSSVFAGPSTAAQTGRDSSQYTFRGVILDSEDLHMLGPDPLSNVPESSSSYLGTGARDSNQLGGSVTPQPGWQTSFSLSGGNITPQQQQQQQKGTQQQQQLLSPGRPTLAMPMPGAASNWNFSSFHGFAPITTPGVELPHLSFDRPASAPPPMSGGLEVVIQDHSPSGEASVGFAGNAVAAPGPVGTMDRRRGSSIDSPALLPFASGEIGSYPGFSPGPSYQPASSYLPAQPGTLQNGGHLMAPPPTDRVTKGISTSPVYLGPGPSPKGGNRLSYGPNLSPPKSVLALRRATVGPQPLTIPNNNFVSVPSSSAPYPFNVPATIYSVPPVASLDGASTPAKQQQKRSSLLPSPLSPLAGARKSVTSLTSPPPINASSSSSPPTTTMMPGGSTASPSSSAHGAPSTVAAGTRRVSITSPTAPTRRFASRAGSGSGRRGSGNSAPLFINFTSRDATKLLSGVAPSGSSKRKREEEEQARLAKLARGELLLPDGGSPTSPSQAGELPSTTPVTDSMDQQQQQQQHHETDAAPLDDDDDALPK